MSQHIDLPDSAYRKSSRSGTQGQCVEVADVLAWRRSRRSGLQGNCVELRDAPDAIVVRDSKDPGGPKLMFSRLDFRTFAEDAKVGKHDL